MVGWKIVVKIPQTTCPHCGKAISIGILRIGAAGIYQRNVPFPDGAKPEVKGLLFSDDNEIECPRSECGKLIGWTTLVPLFAVNEG